jgi:hypothetical protein
VQWLLKKLWRDVTIRILFVCQPKHIDVCKPESEMDIGFQHLVQYMKEVVEDVNKNLGNTLDILGPMVGIKDKLQEVWKRWKYILFWVWSKWEA